MASTKPNPKRLAAQIIAGSFLAGASFFTTLLPVFHANPLPPELRTLRAFALIMPFALGLTLWGLSYRQLKRGHDNDLWPEGELAPVRSLVNQSYWTWLFLSLFAIAIAVISFTSHGGLFVYIAMLPLNALSGIRRLLSPATEPTNAITMNSRDAKPLHSNHWGEAPRPRNDALPS